MMEGLKEALQFITKLKEDTGWTPEISLDQTITETLDAYRNTVE